MFVSSLSQATLAQSFYVSEASIKTRCVYFPTTVIKKERKYNTSMFIVNTLLYNKTTIADVKKMSASTLLRTICFSHSQCKVRKSPKNGFFQTGQSTQHQKDKQIRPDNRPDNPQTNSRQFYTICNKPVTKKSKSARITQSAKQVL